MKYVNEIIIGNDEEYFKIFNNIKMLPFDLDKALDGYPLVTKNGFEVINFDVDFVIDGKFYFKATILTKGRDQQGNPGGVLKRGYLYDGTNISYGYVCDWLTLFLANE